MKKKTGDNYPVDVKGQMMYVGSIVVVPITIRTDEPDSVVTTSLKLGFVKKLTQKRGVDIQVFSGAAEGKEFINETVRFENPTATICIVSAETLKLRDPLHEAVRFSAAMARNDE